MRITASSTLGDLESDLRTMTAESKPAMARIVQSNVLAGNALAQRFARAASGPHGRLYYKRITSEMTGLLSGTYGPTGSVAGNAVGAGWRHGPSNQDLPKSADIIGPKFAKDASDLLDDLFWPGA